MTNKRKKMYQKLPFSPVRLLATIAVFVAGLVIALVLIRSSQDNRSSASSPVKDIRDVAITPSQLKKLHRYPETNLLNLTFTMANDAELKLTQIFRHQGTPIAMQFDNPIYTAQLLKTGQVIKQLDFSIPTITHEQEGKPTETQQQTKFTIQIEDSANADTVVILDELETVIAERKLTNVPVRTITPNFYSIKAADYQTGRRSVSLNLPLINPVHALNTTQGYVDFVFISQGFTVDQMGEFRNSVQLYMDKLLSQPAYRDRADQIMFHILENTTDLGCTSPSICDGDHVNRTYELMVNSGVPYDMGDMVINSTATNGGAGITVLRLAKQGKSASGVFLHEVAHITGSLNDEYLLGSSGTLSEAPRGTCYAGNPSYSAWNMLVPGSEYYAGCTYENWYRIGQNSILRSTGSNYFNVIGHIVMQDFINEYAGKSSDLERPTMVITQPSHGSPVSGTVSINTTASDNKSVNWSQLWVDDRLVATKTIAPFTFTWDSANAAVGWHKITVKGFDAAGNMGIDVAYISKGTTTAPPAKTFTQADFRRVAYALPLENTYVSSTSPTADNSQTNILQVRAGTIASKSYIKFNHPGMTADQIESATMYVTFAQPSTDAVVTVKELLSDEWTASSLNYQNQPAAGATITSFNGKAMYAQQSFNVTPQYQRTSQPVSVVLEGTNSYSAQFSSMANYKLFNRPFVEIIYYDVYTPTIPPVQPTSEPTPLASATPLPTQSPTPTPTLVNVAPVIQTKSLPAAKVGRTYSQKIVAYDVNRNDLLEISTTNLPPGLALGNCSSEWNTANNYLQISCTLTGSFSAKATYNPTLTVSDGAGHQVSKTYRLQVK